MVPSLRSYNSLGPFPPLTLRRLHSHGYLRSLLGQILRVRCCNPLLYCLLVPVLSWAAAPLTVLVS